MPLLISNFESLTFIFPVLSSLFSIQFRSLASFYSQEILSDFGNQIAPKILQTIMEIRIEPQQVCDSVFAVIKSNGSEMKVATPLIQITYEDKLKGPKRKK